MNLLRVLCVLFYASALGFAEPTLRITSPVDGVVVNPGQTVKVTVEASGGPFQAVFIIGHYSIGATRPLAVPPYEFDVYIPEKIQPGKYLITARGSTSPGHGARSKSVVLMVERADEPTKLRVQPSGLYGMLVGDKGHPQVEGIVGEGEVVQLTASKRTEYSSMDPKIASVEEYGIVTALSPGSTTLVVTYGKLKVEVPIKVLNKPR